MHAWLLGCSNSRGFRNCRQPLSTATPLHTAGSSHLSYKISVTTGLMRFSLCALLSVSTIPFHLMLPDWLQKKNSMLHCRAQERSACSKNQANQSSNHQVLHADSKIDSKNSSHFFVFTGLQYSIAECNFMPQCSSEIQAHVLLYCMTTLENFK